MLEGINLVYDNVDLGKYDAAYAGRTLRVLQNPSREFRMAYITSTYTTGSGEWIKLVAKVLGVDSDAEVERIIAPLETDVIVWMFIGLVDDYDAEKGRFNTVIRPYLVEGVWDEYVRARVKAHAGR